MGTAPLAADMRSDARAPQASAAPGILLQVENLHVEFRTARGIVTAVEDLSFSVSPVHAARTILPARNSNSMSRKIAIAATSSGRSAEAVGGLMLTRSSARRS